MPRIPRRVRVGLVTAVATALPLVLLFGPAGSASTETGAPPERQLADSIDMRNVKRHLEKLQSIANTHGGTRASGTSGDDASRDYVAGELRGAGYQVTLQAFTFPSFRERTAPIMEQVSSHRATFTPIPQGSNAFGDFASSIHSGSGDVEAAIQGVDLTLPPGPRPNSSTSGCEAADFAGFTRGNIALLQRGICTFADQARNAQAAAASGVIIFNEGQRGRTEVFTEPLDQTGITIPVVGASFAVGQRLASPGKVVRLKTNTESAPRTTYNLLAESKQGNANNVVMAGAHLDSVRTGAGINDNGSGVAGLLEVARRMATVQPKNKLRFAFWGAEELGLLGSKYYVSNLSKTDHRRIGLYLNFDMIASPNFAYMIRDGSAGPAGSTEIEKNFARYYDVRNLPHISAPLNGRSDYDPFMRAGIPIGGVFTGSDGIKTPEEQRMFGGQAGRAYDYCYHRPCDTTTNINDTALTVNTGAIAHAVQTYASTDDLPARHTARNPSLQPPRSRGPHR
ncbi:M28 family metallopeptidase [Nocardia sp. CDC159]|uniref:M28 family metallopeptidase n=1 Tax=Nocardia pulmonis TaxID=2951408 RepID=A0A9X2J001_9NOCA|nr:MULTISPECIES: M28 family metallopeptidase [Nocardia]MCM6776605.1 M28 family metallopeptidase [Nocardia pulmonis]MCM6789246.1 M28 family metallopeptidase [Nocardia sp. CDC159]